MGFKILVAGSADMRKSGNVYSVLDNVLVFSKTENRYYAVSDVNNGTLFGTNEEAIKAISDFRNQGINNKHINTEIIEC
jgi:hypothetical protein